MRIPEFLSTRLTRVSRGPGQSWAAAVAYIAGVRIRDSYTGEMHDFRSKSGVLDVHVCGWGLEPDETIVSALQRLADAVAAVRRTNALLGYSFRFDLPAEATSPQRLDLVRWAVEEMRIVLQGAAVAGALHAPSDRQGGGDPRAHHGHAVATRWVSDGNILGPPIPTFERLATGSAALQTLRQRMCVRYNEMAERFGWGRSWTSESYNSWYGGANRARTTEGLELLETPLAMHHEGARVTAVRRRNATLGLPLDLDVVRQNDAVREHNRAVQARNLERRSRDAQILELRQRLTALREIEALIHGGDHVASEHRRLKQRVGNITDLQRRVALLPGSALEVLRPAHPAMVDRILREGRHGDRGRGHGR